jgi:DNA ligase-1
MIDTIPRGTYPGHFGPVVEIGGLIYTIMKSSDVIESDGSKTKKYWQGHVLRSPGQQYFTSSSSWRATKDGLSKVVWSEPYYADPTSVGRSNERNNEQQAYFEFESMVNKQTDKRLSDKPLPMLAHTFRNKIDPKKSKEKHIKYPCMVQPKFDGMRVLFDGTEPWSRGNKPIVPECFAHLSFDTQGSIIDGELILPGNLKVNETSSAAKKFHPGVSDTLQYRVYDIVDSELPYVRRLEKLTLIVAAANNPNIILAPTVTVHDVTEVLAAHEEFVSQGYEGTIIRNMDAKYTINKRTNDLQKHKDFIDAEFEIVDVIPAGGGSSADVGKFVCKSPADATEPTFESTATGTWEERHKYLINKDKYIGKFAKVKFREYTSYGQPFHSNVLEIRETKDAGY